MTLRSQMCGDEDLIEFDNSDGLHVIFHQPVLYEDDITSMLGIPPFLIEGDEDRLELRYLVNKLPTQGEPDWSIPIDLSFAMIDGRYRLQGFSVETDLPVAVDAERVEQMTSASCSTPLMPWRRSIAIEMSPEDLAMAPTRTDVVTLAGAPTRSNEDLTELHYEFQILGNEDDQGSASVAMYFDGSGETLMRIRSSFLYFGMDADFETGIASAKIDL